MAASWYSTGPTLIRPRRRGVLPILSYPADWYQFVSSVYGPLWTVISGGIVLAGGGHVGLTLLIFQSLGSSGGVGQRRFYMGDPQSALPRPRRCKGPCSFYGTQLVIIESALGGHNDTCMMFLALLAVWLHLRGSKAGAVIALTLSALVKVITAALVPLYMLMILRGATGWKERGWFLLRAGLGAAAAVAASMLCARMSPNGVTLHTASTAQFFENNYHELLFKGLRRVLGEPGGFHSSAHGFSSLLGGNERTRGSARRHLEQNGRPLPPEDRTSIARDLRRRLRRLDAGLRSGEPDARVCRLAASDRHRRTRRSRTPTPPCGAFPAGRRIGRRWSMANRLIRVTTWSLFIAFGLLAAWKTTDFDAFLTWSTAFFLASQLLVFTKIWPWYAVWPLAFGALKPRSAATRLAIMLSAGMIIIYVLFDYSSSDRWSWVNDYRSIPTIVLPVVLFAILQWSTRSALVLPILSGTLPAGKRAANPSPGPESEGFKER